MCCSRRTYTYNPSRFGSTNGSTRTRTLIRVFLKISSGKDVLFEDSEHARKGEPFRGFCKAIARRGRPERRVQPCLLCDVRCGTSCFDCKQGTRQTGGNQDP